MANKELETINVGIVGHIDHGKTTLLYKLSGKWASQHSQELKRGITIKLGYADIVLYKDKDAYNNQGGEPVRHVSFVDAPGHEMLMATMLSGAAIIDAAILVIAANEGIKPQTREHVMALQAKGIKKVIVVQNKIDLVDKKRALESYTEIKNFLKGMYDDAQIIPVSAQQGVNIDKVFEALANLSLPKREENAIPIFLVARSFDINRPGTKPNELHGMVLGGTLKQGTLKKGDVIEIKPGLSFKEANKYSYKTLKGTVLHLFKGSKSVDELTPGGSMSIETSLDMSIGKGDALAGNVVSIAGKLPETSSTIKVAYNLFPEVFGVNGHVKSQPLKMSEVVLLSINTSMTIGVIKKLSSKEVELSLKMPVVAFKGDTVALSRNVNNHWRLIGYGSVA